VRILWHSAAPWCPTGYGVQTALWCRYLRDQGHDVAISAYYGNPGKVRRWDGMTVYPPPQDGDVTSLIIGHARKHKADVIILLADVWLMESRQFADFRTYAWVPVDSRPLSIGDTLFLKANPAIIPVAMSEHGQAVMADAGLTASYIPHAIDTEVYRPPAAREELRAAYGIARGHYAIGMNFNNIDPFRKATPEQFWAFAQFARKHEATLFVHSMVTCNRSLDLRLLAKTLHIEDKVRFADQYRLQAGDYDADEMARWYGAMDVISNATMGEGFGLPAIEAQACGTPVILSDNSSGPQLVGPGWLVPTEPFWNLTHASWWGRPSTAALARTYEKAWASQTPFKRQACRVNAEKYDIRAVGPMWSELLESAA
jgi:glycosyltransferase involved in cell wall biosynthesis